MWNMKACKFLNSDFISHTVGSLFNFADSRYGAYWREALVSKLEELTIQNFKTGIAPSLLTESYFDYFIFSYAF